MTTQYHSNFNKTYPVSDVCAQLHLTATNVLTYTVAGDEEDKYRVCFSYNATSNVFVGLNVTPVIPAGNTITDDAHVEYRPSERYAQGGDEINFVSPDADVYMGISLLTLPG